MKKCLFTLTLNAIVVGVYAQTPETLQTVTDRGRTTSNRIVLGSTVDDGFSRLQVTGSVSINTGLTNASDRPQVVSGTLNEIRGVSNTSYYADDGFLRVSAGGGTHSNVKTYIDLSGYSTKSDMNGNIVLGTSGVEQIRINSSGYVGIGVTNPMEKLDVNGNSLIKGSITSSVTGNIGGFVAINNPSKTAPGSASSWKIYNMTGTFGNSLQFWAYDNLGCSGGLCVPRLTLMDNGNVGIGTRNPQSMLAVAGAITAQKVKVTSTGWSDFVFDKSYNLLPLASIEQYINLHKHLPDIPSEAVIVKDGLNIGEMQQKQMQKIEELTLYLIQQNKQLEKQQQLLLEQEKRIRELEKRLSE
ncbi:hypothetical protein [Chitinophaga sp. 212800010-3]|uniref:hypothetical protein n=1 Tax=unclassified Chitinophaga TaxID=2619133 RepID=UPI002DE871F5|nr:Cell wall anchor protein [Chitinophaga sp. 212800010-3]